jgi:hypothetical protein
MLDPYVPYLLRRWNEGCHNGKKLYREMRELDRTRSFWRGFRRIVRWRY